MRIVGRTLIAASLLAAAAASPALSQSGTGGGGGDREPAGGAFNSSYPEQGSTGIQRGGPPRSVDIPRPDDSAQGQMNAGRPPGRERAPAR